jgi:hypothetical protein
MELRYQDLTDYAVTWLYISWDEWPCEEMLCNYVLQLIYY